MLAERLDASEGEALRGLASLCRAFFAEYERAITGGGRAAVAVAGNVMPIKRRSSHGR